MARPTREDAHLKSMVVQTSIALLIAMVLLLIVFVWLFNRLLS
jgi:hypothetical protein